MKDIPTQSTDPLPCPEYQVVVNGRPVTVHGAKSCQAPFPFRCFKAGTHPGIKLERPDAWGGPAQIAEAGNAPETEIPDADDPHELRNLWNEPKAQGRKSALLARLVQRLAQTDRFDSTQYCGA